MTSPSSLMFAPFFAFAPSLLFSSFFALIPMLFPFPRTPVFFELPVRDSLMAGRNAAIIVRQIDQYARHSVGRDKPPGPVVVGPSVPSAFIRAIPIPMVEKEVCIEIG